MPRKDPKKTPDLLLSEYVRRGRPGDNLAGHQIYLIQRVVCLGQDAYRVHNRSAEGVAVKKVIIDNGLQEADLTEKLDAAEVASGVEHILKVDQQSGRVYVIAKTSALAFRLFRSFLLLMSNGRHFTVSIISFHLRCALPFHISGEGRIKPTIVYCDMHLPPILNLEQEPRALLQKPVIQAIVGPMPAPFV